MKVTVKTVWKVTLTHNTTMCILLVAIKEADVLFISQPMGEAVVSSASFKKHFQDISSSPLAHLLDVVPSISEPPPNAEIIYGMRCVS